LTVGATAVNPDNAQEYLDGDIYGVQAAPVTTADDMRGPNEEFRFLRDAFDFATVEHDANGIHDTLQIARALLDVTWNAGASAYEVSGHSYLLGTHEHDGVIATVADGAAGEITVTLATALPSATKYAVVDLTGCLYDATDTMLFTRTQLMTKTSSTVMALRRWEGATVGTMAQAHGDFRILIHAEA
jgi:hypothetical protein